MNTSHSQRTVFFSWQSDIRAAATRSLIQDALEKAAHEIRADDTIEVDPVIDRDTADVPGSPDIGRTIFEKIDRCAVFVADVTIITGDAPRPSPNPNVLIELGYAYKSRGDQRVILVQNVAFGGPEKLPFDLRQKRVLKFDSPLDAVGRADTRRDLQNSMRAALAAVLRHPLSIPSDSAMARVAFVEAKDKARSQTVVLCGGITTRWDNGAESKWNPDNVHIGQMDEDTFSLGVPAPHGNYVLNIPYDLVEKPFVDAVGRLNIFLSARVVLLKSGLELEPLSRLKP